ncbi:MAG: four helix bundle protein [Verrucomicrobiota bacterium]
MKIHLIEDLDTYREAFDFQQSIFEKSKSWPREESYSLIDQIRRSSRSVGASLSEAWAKREYPAHFHSKLTDSDSELLETGHWLRTARSCGYLSDEDFQKLKEQRDTLGRRIGKMIQTSNNFCSPRKK